MNEKLIEALNKEDTEAQAVMARNVSTDGWSPELREVREIAQRASIADYVLAAVQERTVDGAAKEYSDHVFGSHSPGDYPLEMLLDRDEFFDMSANEWKALKAEDRAIITGIAATHGNPTLRRPAAGIV